MRAEEERGLVRMRSACPALFSPCASLRCGRSQPPRDSMIRIASLLIVLIAGFAAPPASAADPAFEQWLQSLWPEAQKLGVSRATFDAATRGLEPDLSLPDLVVPGRPEAPPRGQAEFVQTPADYVRESTIA